MIDKDKEEYELIKHLNIVKKRIKQKTYNLNKKLRETRKREQKLSKVKKEISETNNVDNKLIKLVIFGYLIGILPTIAIGYYYSIIMAVIYTGIYFTIICPKIEKAIDDKSKRKVLEKTKNITKNLDICKSNIEKMLKYKKQLLNKRKQISEELEINIEKIKLPNKYKQRKEADEFKRIYSEEYKKENINHEDTYQKLKKQKPIL